MDLSSTWQPDRLLDGFEQLTLPLPGARRTVGEGPEVELVATLVRQRQPRSRRALLYVHGWSDYFFQAHLAESMQQLGWDFHAVDLRRYGRSLRDGMVPGFIDDVGEYAEEMDAALAVVLRDHDRVTVMGHSTGGLVTALWLDRRPAGVDGLVLNSPWLAQGGSPLRNAATRQLLQAFRRQPTRVFPTRDTGFYTRSIDPQHPGSTAGHPGEWTIEQDLKGSAFQVRMGWGAAIMQGHQRVASGLSIDVPVLVLTSGRSDFRKQWDDALLAADTVLDVEAITAAATRLGRHVTIVRIEGGVHDLALSRPEPRRAFLDEVAHFKRCYLD